MNGLKHGISPVHHIIIPKSNHPVTFRLQPTRANLVTAAVDMVCVLRSVDLYDQALGQTSEVCDIRSDNDLPFKMTSPYFKPSKMMPQNVLRDRRICSESFSQSFV
jgi:hypothetical protein